MSNIHRLNDFEDGSSRPNASNVPFLGGRVTNTGNPRNESFFNFIKNFCCPYSTWKSFIFIISMLDIFMYILTLSFGIGISTKEAPYLLPPKPEILDKFGDLVYS